MTDHTALTLIATSMLCLAATAQPAVNVLLLITVILAGCLPQLEWRERSHAQR